MKKVLVIKNLKEKMNYRKLLIKKKKKKEKIDMLKVKIII